MTPLLLVAGEASGDLHGARLLTELRRLIPDLAPFGLGGDEMTAAGLDAVGHSGEIAVVGLVEALRVLPRAWRIFDRLLEEVERRDARHAVLIDAPDFNLRLARRLARRGVRVVYYVSPQIWAWRRGRVRTIARVVDRMLVLFPFEEGFYREHGVDVVHVGHPLVDEVPELPQAWDDASRAPAEPFTVALLPGSRASEVRSLLPELAAAVTILAERLPVAVRLIQAPTIPDALLDELLAGYAGPPLERIRRDRYRAVAASHLALCASGTATVETALLGTPLVVVYRLAPWTYTLARRLVKLPHISMVNLVLGERAVPELVQDEASPEGIATTAERLLRDPDAIATMRAKLAELRRRLGTGGASRRAAEEVAAVVAAEVAA